MIERGFEKAQQLRENKGAVRQFAIQRAMDILKAAGVVDPKLEAVAHSATSDKEIKSEAPKVDLRQQTYDLLSHVREPLAEEKEALKGRGLVFLSIGRKSYAQVVAEDEGYFLSGELDYANVRPQLRDYVLPVAAEVGLNPTELALRGSFNKSRADQLERIKEYSQLLQLELPDARAIMLPSTGYAQADKAYKLATGEVLFRNYFARVLDDLSGFVAAAGRDVPSRQFRVDDWNADYGYGPVGAVPAVVFVGNK